MKSPLNQKKHELRREMRESKKILELTRDDSDIEAVKKRGKALWDLGGAMMELERFAEAVPYYEQADLILWRFQNLHAAAVVGCTQRGLALLELGRSEEALSVFTGLLDKVGLDAVAADLPDLVTTAIQMRLSLLEVPDRTEELGCAAEAIIEALEPGSTQRKRQLVARAMVIRGSIARARGDSRASLAAFDDAIERARHQSTASPEVEARALSGRAWVLADLERTGEAIAVCDDLLQRFGDDPSGPWTVRALMSAQQLKQELNS